METQNLRTHLIWSAVLGLLCFLAFGFSLTYPGIYWDDWVTFFVSKEGLMRTYVTAGFPLTGYFHLSMRELGPIGYRFAVLASSLAIALLFYATVVELKSTSLKNARILSALFLLAPLNTSRWTAINTPAMIFTLIF